MKKFLTIQLALIFSAALCANLFAFPRSESYRERATAGFFKNNYDRINDNPAYVGAKIKIFDYARVGDQGGEIEQKSKTDIYTTLDGLNTDGRFLLGGLSSLGFIGIGGFVELGKSESPNSLNFSRNVGNATVSSSGEDGAFEGNSTFFSGTAVDQPYTSRETMTLKDENNTTDNHLNFKLAVGGLAVGPMILGLSVGRSTDGSDETKHTGSFSGSQVRLVDNFTEFSTSGSFENTETNTETRYDINLGLVLALGGALETVELLVGYGIIQDKLKTTNNGSYVDSFYTGTLYSRTYSGNLTGGSSVVSEERDQGGSELYFRILTREKVAGWHLDTGIDFAKGGDSPYKSYTEKRADTAQNYTTSYTEEPDRVNSVSDSGMVEWTGDARSRTEIGVGFLARKEVAKGLLFGFGLSFTNESIKDNYKNKESASRITTINDGNGIPEASDSILTTSASRNESITVEQKNNAIRVPIGLEYQATPNLSWRLGATHTTRYESTVVNTKIDSISAPYNDYDYGNIEGNETDSDTKVNPSSFGSTIGGINFNPSERDHVSRNVEKYMVNEFYIGLGYLMASKVQLDLLLYAAATNYEAFDTGAVFASATYMIE